MTTRAKTTHPSDELYNGGASDFLDALRLVRAACQHERAIIGPTGDSPGSPYSIEGYARRATQAGDIYRAAVQAAHAAAIEEMRAAGLTEFADALETGDYAQLAI